MWFLFLDFQLLKLIEFIFQFILMMKELGFIIIRLFDKFNHLSLDILSWKWIPPRFRQLIVQRALMQALLHRFFWILHLIALRDWLCTEMLFFPLRGWSSVLMGGITISEPGNRYRFLPLVKLRAVFDEVRKEEVLIRSFEFMKMNM